VLGGGLGWVFLVMAACGSYYRTSIRRVRRNFRDDINREMAKQRLETDTESLEWINSFLVKFWPIYAPVLCDTIIKSVDQVLSTSTPAFLDSLRLKTFILGTKPPRLEHVKTYPKTEVDTVLMDWKFSFTPNDTMDLTARQLKDKINPKVVLEVRIGKGVVSKGLDVIVENFAFSGLMRLKVKLQIPFPHIDRVDMCFLERPDIDYVCKPLGGDLLGFDINFIPGLESFIKEQIHGNLGPMMYEPNVFPIEIAKMLAGNPVDQAIGVLAVTFHGAANLKGADRLGNTVDPYVSVSLNSRNELARTKTIQDTSNPRWNETLYIIISSFTDALTMHVFDFNDYRKDKEVGVATFPLDRLEQEHDHESLNLDITYSGRNRGVLQADVRFCPVLEGRTIQNGETEPPPELNTGVARFAVEQAKDLDGSKSLIGSLNPYAVLLLNGKEVHTTNKLKRTNNPIFQNASKELLITDRKSARLGLVIKDDRDLAGDPVIGKYQIKMNDMLRMMEKGQEWFQLAGAKTGRVKMMLAWKPVALSGVAGGSGYVAPIGVVRLHLKSAADLRNLETMGKSDPYVRVLLSGIPKGRTVTFKNNLNPDWDEVIYVPVHSAREKLTLEVMDEESLGKDRTLGEVEVALSDYVHENETGEYEVDDEKQSLKSGLRLRGRGAAKGFLNYTVAFYPTLNVVDPEEEADEEEEASAESEGRPSTSLTNRSDSIKPTSTHKRTTSTGSELTRTSTDTPKTNGRVSLDVKATKALGNGDAASLASPVVKDIPKIFIGTEDLQKYGMYPMSPPPGSCQFGLIKPRIRLDRFQTH
jgi:Ca2+-dependent lipid-binding protein